MWNFTFGFSNNIISPPFGIYTAEPNVDVLFPKGVSLGRMEFGVRVGNGGLVRFSVLDHEQEEITEIKSTLEENKTKEFDFT